MALLTRNGTALTCQAFTDNRDWPAGNARSVFFRLWYLAFLDVVIEGPTADTKGVGNLIGPGEAFKW